MADPIAFQMDLIPRQKTGETGKTVGSLNDSRMRRTEILRMFRGVLPQSIMVAEKQHKHDDLAVGSYAASSHVQPEDAESAGLARAWETSGRSVRGGKTFDVSGQGGRAGALSQFPQNIGRSVLLLYSQPGSTVVDPFAGHNSRMELCVREGRHYIGQDISAEFMAWNGQVAARLHDEYPHITTQLILGDSRQLQVEDGAGDFTLTSPPYYNLEYYGDEPEQLGQATSYEEFLAGLGEVAWENYRALKPGSFCIWFVNDFRLDGRFHLYHIDALDLLLAAGFEAWDVMVVDLGAPIRAAFASQIVDQQILPKRHEYGLVVRKPGAV